MSVSFPLKFTSLSSPTAGAPVEPISQEITELKSNQVLVKIAYASLNYMDPRLQATNTFNLPLPLTVGFDYSGTVVALGSDVKELIIGDKVFGWSLRGGCFAEYVTIPYENLVVKTNGIPLKKAGAYSVAYLSAYQPLMLVEDLSKRNGQTIYVAGGAGGVGHFAVLLAKLHGLTVIASGGKPETLDVLKQLGVDHIIDYRKPNVIEEILKITRGRGVDIAYDSTYIASSFIQSASVIASNGVWIRLGGFNHIVDDSEARKIIESRGGIAKEGETNKWCFDPTKIPLLRQGLENASEWYKQGKLKPFIGSILPFEAKALQDALNKLGNRTAAGGKTILHVSD